MVMQDQPQKTNSLAGLRAIGLFTTIPMVMLAGLLVGYFLGQFADKTFGWEPWGKIGLSLFGVTAGFVQTIRLIQQATKESEPVRKQ